MSLDFRGARKLVRAWPAVLASCLVAAAVASFAPGAARSRAGGEALVREFVAAFNARNIEAMLAAVDEDVQWLGVSGAEVTVETEGRRALGESMGRYFRGCPSCRSSLEWVRQSGSRVTAMERATWTGADGAKSQTSLSVYEFRGGKILRVYYFPAEAEAAPAKK